MLKILIVEGNEKSAREKAVRDGMATQSALYETVLHSLADDIECMIVYPSDDGADLPTRDQLAAFDGIVWTGSALNIYKGGDAVDRQVEFMKRCFEAKSRIFGSCWGLQVASAAGGGKVALNPKGREIGVARDIQLTDAGRSHPMYEGKPAVFDAVAIHLDNIVEPPPGAKILSRNAMSEVQALEMEIDGAVFWGVQYHPEFDLDYIAGLIRRYKDMLVEEGIGEDGAAVEKWAADLTKAANDNEDAAAVRKRYDLEADVLDPRCRLREVSNWLSWLREGRRETGAGG